MHSVLDIYTTWIAERGVNKVLLSALSEGLSGVRLILKGMDETSWEALDCFCYDIKRISPLFKIMVDLPGTKPRLGHLKHALNLSFGDTIELAYTSEVSANQIPTECLMQYSESIKCGQHLLVNDGKTTFEVTGKTKQAISVTLVDESATIISGRSINLPDSDTTFSALSNIDIQSIEKLKNREINSIAISMVNSPDEMKRAKVIMEKIGVKSELIAKIETPFGIDNVDEISLASDSMMIARGDMTTICGENKVFAGQNKVISAAVKHNKDIIAATGILSSLSLSHTPSIGDVCDVSYLLSFGLKRFLISDATLALQYPERACKWLKKLCDST